MNKTLKLIFLGVIVCLFCLGGTKNVSAEIFDWDFDRYVERTEDYIRIDTRFHLERSQTNEIIRHSGDLNLMVEKLKETTNSYLQNFKFRSEVTNSLKDKSQVQANDTKEKAKRLKEQQQVQKQLAQQQKTQMADQKYRILESRRRASEMRQRQKDLMRDLNTNR